MFEHTLLTHPPTARKTGALFASLAAQILVCGVLLITPLIFTDALPAFRIARVNGFAPPLPPAPPPMVQTAASAATARQFNPFQFLAPARVPQGPVPDIIVDAPNLPAGMVDAGAPLLPGVIATPIGRFAPPPPKPVVAEPAATKPVPPAAPMRVSEGTQMAKLVKKVVPAYPEMARRIRVSGTVELLGIIAKDGRIRKLKVLSGHPLLRQAALDAVSQWVYSPTLLSGQPIEVEAPIDVIFEFR